MTAQLLQKITGKLHLRVTNNSFFQKLSYQTMAKAQKITERILFRFMFILLYKLILVKSQSARLRHLSSDKYFNSPNISPNVLCYKFDFEYLL